MPDLEDLRRVLDDREQLAPEPAGIAAAARASGVRTRRRRAAAAVAGSAVAVVAVVALGATVLGGPQAAREPAATPTAAPGEPPLVGTTWQLVSWRGTTVTPVPGTEDSTLLFSPTGTAHAHTCNSLDATFRVEGRTITFGQAMRTDVACAGTGGMLDDRAANVLTGSASWSISGRMLTLTDEGGLALTYRVRPSIYPNMASQTVVEGDHAGGRFRLSYDRTGGGLGLDIETRPGPGEPFGTSGVLAPGPGDCVANSVTQATIGADTYVAAWVTPAVTRVAVRPAPGAPERVLTSYAVAGTELRIAGGWVPGFRPGTGVVTFYNGNEVVAATGGPC